jgi:hypothetical protein
MAQLFHLFCNIKVVKNCRERGCLFSVLSCLSINSDLKCFAIYDAIHIVERVLRYVMVPSKSLFNAFIPLSTVS